jgi:hypothetical protein
MEKDIQEFNCISFAPAIFLKFHTEEPVKKNNTANRCLFFLTTTIKPFTGLR